MASLAGKADPTLAKMAYAASMANVPGDYSEHYQSIVDAQKELMGGIEEIAAGFKLENDLATLELKKAMKIFEDPLNLQMIDSDYTEMQADITAQREEWKANKGFKNDPEGRQDWDRRNQQIIGRHEQDNANLGTVQAGIDGNLYDLENMEIGKKKFFTDLAKYQANQDKQSGIHNADATKYMKDNPNATPAQLWKKLGIVKEGVVVKFKDPVTGEYTYVSKVGEDLGTKEPLFESQKSSELLDYVNKDARADDTLVKAQALYQDRLKISNGRSDDYSGFRNEDRNALEELLDTDMLNNPNTLKYMMHKKIGGEKLSFAEALRGGKALGLTDEIIIALGATTSDGDDILEESDFATAKSYETVVNNILSGKAIYKEDGKNKSLDTKGLYLDYTIDNAFKTGHNQYKKKVDKGDGGKDDRIIKKDIKLGPLQNWGTQADIDPEIANSMLEDIKTGTHFPFMGSFYDYDVENGQWVETNAKSGEETARFDGAQELSDNVFKTPHPAFQNLTTTVKDRIDPKTGEIIKEKKPVKQAKGTYVISAPTINMKTLAQDDDEVVKNLNDLMPTEFSTANPNGYKFDQIGAFPFPDDPGRQAIQLLDGSNKNKVVVWPKGHKYAGEKVGLNIRKNKKETLDWINDILITFGLADNMKTNTSTSGNLPIVTWEEED